MNSQEKAWFDANKHLWNEKVPVHLGSSFYDMAAFRAGQSSLQAIEVEGLGDVSGKSMLHLQCHFGQDTLSWVFRTEQPRAGGCAGPNGSVVPAGR